MEQRPDKSRIHIWAFM